MPSCMFACYQAVYMVLWWSVMCHTLLIPSPFSPPPPPPPPPLPPLSFFPSPPALPLTFLTRARRDSLLILTLRGQLIDASGESTAWRSAHTLLSLVPRCSVIECLVSTVRACVAPQVFVGSLETTVILVSVARLYITETRESFTSTRCSSVQRSRTVRPQ